ncbi:MAG: carboxylesterase/lipase family protein, partial [Vicinamibacterales bacterium]
MKVRSIVLPYAIALAVSCGGTDIVNDPVAVAGGRVQGQLVDEDIRVFRGIPYAAPPVGNLRWRPPQRVVPWEGLRDATAYGAECPQSPLPPTSIYARPEQPQSEDCLFLNVWAPPPASAPLPVVVWIHGGDLTRGSGASDFGPDGSGIPFARKGIVVVSLNHRLGALGYLAHPELSAESPEGVSGDYGLLDQIAALQWVRDNIAAFGGDPARVTIAGQSGGAASVSALIASPLARGLFARAIGQSGGLFGPGVVLRDAPEGGVSAEDAGLEFARELLGSPPEESLRALRSAPTDAVLRTGFVPRETVDGWVLPGDVPTMIRERRHNNVPV